VTFSFRIPHFAFQIRAAGAPGRLPPLVLSGKFPLVQAGFENIFPVFNRFAPVWRF
jgi:hypothetical protein